MKESVERSLEIHRDVARLGEDGTVHIQRLHSQSPAASSATSEMNCGLYLSSRS